MIIILDGDYDTSVCDDNGYYGAGSDHWAGIGQDLSMDFGNFSE